ncbi:MAG: hypothetical protein SFV51_01725 [Bryobacteraceae bacterium]|nr:hypothetical protein [Bryobacteraceae bacterium]
MLTKVAEQVGGKAGEEWIGGLTHAFLFWAGGLAAWACRNGWYAGWTELVTAWRELPEGVGWVLVVAAVLVVRASSRIVEQFDLPVLRLLEGYYDSAEPGDFGVKDVKDRYQELSQIQGSRALNSEQRRELAELEANLRHIPARDEDRMPTRLGNTLRAAERRPLEKYGLDVAVCWPRLWMLLPKEAREDLSEFRTKLDEAARAWVWSMLFLLSTYWAWWAFPVGVLSAVFAYWRAVDAAETYGDLLESAFDVHRNKLYEAVRWAKPANAAAELQAGRALTEYLLRGSDSPALIFSDPARS